MLCLILALTIIFSKTIRRHSYIPSYLLVTAVSQFTSILSLLYWGGFMVSVFSFALIEVSAADLSSSTQLVPRPALQHHPGRLPPLGRHR